MARQPGERDYRDLKRPGDVRRPVNVERREWWAMRGADAAQAVAGTLQVLERAQQLRLEQLAIAGRLYGNLAMTGAAAQAYGRIIKSQASRDRITYNAIQEII